MIKSWTDDAWEEFEYWLEQDKKTIGGGEKVEFFA
jgi:toxin YoeB